MAADYSVDTVKRIRRDFLNLNLHRPMHTDRYEPGDVLSYLVKSVADSTKKAEISCTIEKFAGGGFAGQVYKVRLDSIDGGPVPGLFIGSTYALKILIPPSRFSLLFRNILYGIGFQGPFQIQCNPEAARSGALWQKFIRRAAKIRFGDEKSVNDIHATFVDDTLGSCGELSDWVDGRTWRLEVDQYLDLLGRWKRNKPVDTHLLGSPEFRAKKEFMAEFVALLHEMGAYEFARQYEWSTCKSQPNCLKRTETENDPATGLIAVDFRAGLALLPFLPMSPGDISLILKGIGRGSLVQFDRGSIPKLEAFINKYPAQFGDMRAMLEELKSDERIYRDSVPDVTHNHVRLFYSGRLWSTMLSSAITGWEVRGIIDHCHAEKFKTGRFATVLFMLLGLIPFLGTLIRRIWADAQYRAHYRCLVTPSYLMRAIKGRMCENALKWHRAGRISDSAATQVAGSFTRCMLHAPLSVLPAGLHKLLTDWNYCKERLDYIFRRPVRLYFNAEEREEWLRDMVAEGRAKHIVTESDAQVILSKIKEPFIQKYLKSLAVHVCTLPVTQMVSVSLAIIFLLTHPEMDRAKAWGIAAGIIALFQVVPISPGSLTRGLYVLYLVIRERNVRDYNIALSLGFFKYIGYLSFPIQMAYRYPELARFMAGHWATEAVHIVPVFGETGALLEHWVFSLFYNTPLTIRRRVGERLVKRQSLKPRYWHAGIYAAAFAALFCAADYGYYLVKGGVLPGLRDIAPLTALLPAMWGVLVTLGCGGAAIDRRIIAAVFCGIAVGLLYTAGTVVLSLYVINVPLDPQIVSAAVWRVFVFSIMSALGAVAGELR